VAGTLDFIVIGAQKAGTTALWRYLASHPRLHLPPSKEAAFFSHDPPFSRGFEWYLAEFFEGAPADALWGTATPQYMMGSATADVPEVARRIARQVPEVRLISLLRDPIDRARSQHQMSTHRSIEQRPFEQAMSELLTPQALEVARRTPTETNSYLVQGEYGRILGAYLGEFPRNQLHVAFSRDLSLHRGDVLGGIHAFLGVETAPLSQELAHRFFRGSTRRRIDQEAERLLKNYLEGEVWPQMPRPREARRSFNFWFMQFNMAPGDRELGSLEPSLERRLSEHFREDAARLEELLDLHAPWL